MRLILGTLFMVKATPLALTIAQFLSYSSPVLLRLHLETSIPAHDFTGYSMTFEIMPTASPVVREADMRLHATFFSSTKLIPKKLMNRSTSVFVVIYPRDTRTAPVGCMLMMSFWSQQTWPASRLLLTVSFERFRYFWHAPGLQKHPVRIWIPKTLASRSTVEYPTHSPLESWTLKLTMEPCRPLLTTLCSSSALVSPLRASGNP
mmetsp:Transcript_29177/g.40583  ORF Transcript_29177/g.40583 Transcript_29177/m.40583 type:complete len:205 (-) Transcript_29177:1313-1927(-)